MKITYINNTDLPGRIFNGYDMMNTLNRFGNECYQIVIDKKSDNENVKRLFSQSENHILSLLFAYETEIGCINLLNPFIERLVNHDNFRSADIIHYHLLHNRMISMYDLNKLLKSKPCVWTLHDLWMLTGHCVQPVDCDKWKTGCIECNKKNDEAFPLYHNTSDQMWKIKKQQLEDVNPDIVVSTDFMADCVKKSPITSHFDKIHKIPFGINLNSIKNIDKDDAKKKLGIPKDRFVIGIRDENNSIKGVYYFVEAMKKINPCNITIISVGNGTMLEELSDNYNCVKLGWCNDLDMMDLFYSASDLFAMPSLAESFGLMAIEAMAHETPVVCFDNTVLPEITHSGESGIAVEYKNSDALSEAIVQMKENKDECVIRGKKGREIVSTDYRYDDYINNHISLYESILQKERNV